MLKHAQMEYIVNIGESKNLYCRKVLLLNFYFLCLVGKNCVRGMQHNKKYYHGIFKNLFTSIRKVWFGLHRSFMHKHIHTVNPSKNYLKVEGAQCDRSGGIHSQFKALLAAINQHTSKNELRIANRIYGDQQCKFHQVRNYNASRPAPCLRHLCIDAWHRSLQIWEKYYFCYN